MTDRLAGIGHWWLVATGAENKDTASLNVGGGGTAGKMSFVLKVKASPSRLGCRKGVHP